jgi:hypothetical protein
MELIAVVLLMLLASSLKKLIKSAAYRNRARGKAVLIEAKGKVGRVKAKRKADVIRARTEATVNEAKVGRDRGKKSG